MIGNGWGEKVGRKSRVEMLGRRMDVSDGMMVQDGTRVYKSVVLAGFGAGEDSWSSGRKQFKPEGNEVLLSSPSATTFPSRPAGNTSHPHPTRLVWPVVLCLSTPSQSLASQLTQRKRITR